MLRLARPLFALATLAVLGGAAGLTSATAAPAKSCNIMSDPAGDAIGSTALDVVTGDLASDAKTLTGVIRVVKLAESDPSSPTGIAWGVRFMAPGSDLPYYLLATKLARGDASYSFGQVSGSSLQTLGGASGSIDLAKNEVRIHVKLKDIRLKPGAKITGAFLQGRRVIGDPAAAALYSSADSSDPATAKEYVLGSPSCVTPGK